MPKINDFAPIAPPQNQQLAAPVALQGRAQQGNQAHNLGLNLGEVPDALQNARPSTARIIGRVVLAIVTLGISEGIRAIVDHVRSGPAAENRPLLLVDVPPAQARIDQINSVLASRLGKQGMPEAHMSAMKEALDDLRARFGESIVPPFNGPEDLAALEGKVSLFSLTQSIKQCTEEVTPGKLKSLALNLQEKLAANAMRQCYAEYCNAHNYPEMNILAQFSIDFEKSDSVLQLKACTNTGEVSALFKSLTAMPARLERVNQLNNIERDARELMLLQFSQKTGIPKDLLPHIIQLREIENSFDYLGEDIALKSQSEPEMKAGFAKLVDKYLTDKMDVLEALDTTKTSKELKIMLQNKLLNSTVVKADMLRVAMQVGSSVDTASFAQFLRTEEKPNATRIVQFLSDLGKHVVENRQASLNDAQWSALGGDGQGDFRMFSAQALLHSNPELLAALRSLPQAMRKEVADIFDQQHSDGMQSISRPGASSSQAAVTAVQIAAQGRFFMLAIDATISSTELAEDIVTQKAGAAYVAAIGTAINELRDKNGPQSLPPGYIINWAQENLATQPLMDFKNQIRDLKEAPSSNELASLFTTIMQHAIDNKVFP